MTVGSLFAGIGGFDLGFERAGYEIVWQVEIDEYCRRVLERHFPRAERFGDIRECGAHNLKPVDVICGGFPCQDISTAGRRVGIDGERSGLWSEMRRIVCELRPKFVIVENVAALLHRGMERVLGELAESGYDAEWDVLPACAFGAPHLRERVWIVGYPNDNSLRCGYEQLSSTKGCQLRYESLRRPEGLGSHVANSMRELAKRNNIGWSSGIGWWEREPEEALQDARERGRQENGLPVNQPQLGRLADGIPNRVERLTALGNSIVPQIAQWIAERIKAISGAACASPQKGD